MRTIAITSGKGGVGKTTLACNLSIALAQAGQKVVLFDADLSLANVDVAMGMQSEFNLQHVVAGVKTLREILSSGPAGVQVVSGGSAIPSLMNAGPKRMASFITQLADLAQDTDVLIFDTGAGLDNKVITFMKLAQEIVLVTTPDPTSVTDAYATIKTACRRMNDPVVRVIVNQVGGEREGRQVFSALAGIVKTFLKKDIHWLGYVRQDFQAAAAIRKRRPFVIATPAAWSSEDVREIAATIRREDSVSDRRSA
jgi:flagellar biosynthesis protein FlhG